MRRLLLLSLAVLARCQTQTRFDCFPEPHGASQQACEARGCIWNQQSQPQSVPWCYMAPGVGYKLGSQSGATYSLKKNSGPKNPWGLDFPDVQLTTKTYGSILNVKITSGQRYEPPVDFPKQPATSSEQLTLSTDASTDVFSFAVVRQSNNRKIFDTSIGGLIFSDQFIQIATYLPSENMYGWGENTHQNIKHDFSGYLTWGMFARDQPPNSGSLDTMNLYGVHPYYMLVEPDGKTHGVLILNSNAQEVTTAPGPSLIYKTIGGNLDIYFFPGPTPEQVTQQYLSFIGRPFLPAYWSLGYQLSRYGYKNLDDVKARIGAVRDAGVPIDIGVIDIDYMDRYKDFTTGSNFNGLSSYVQQMHDWSMKLILIFDPAIEVDYPSFQRGISANAKFIEWENANQVMHSIQDMYPLAKDTKIMLGVVWPDNHVAFPDFFDPTSNTQNWWISEFKNYRSQVAFDGIWIDMNEPSNFGTNDPHPWYFDNPDHPNAAPLFCPMNNSWDMPPYLTHSVWRFGDASTGAYLATNTLCLLAVQANNQQRFYNTKNLYGLSEAISTQQALFQSTGKRGAVVSRSTFPSAGRYAGHWLGDNTARWEDLRTSVIGAQEFNLFGIPYVGSDVCGFNGDSNEELCLRWQQMGAFHSFFRNHNTIGAPPQDPAVWPSVAAASKKANLFRYQYLPYLFSLHFIASMNGGTVVRPVFFEFPMDTETLNLSEQFMWGKSMLIAPVLKQGATSVNVYLPEDRWYSLSDMTYGIIVSEGYRTMSAPTTSLIPVFVRGGSIIPRQTPAITTDATRQNPFEALVAPDANGNAEGVLYWDDGETIVKDFGSHPYHQWQYTYNFTSGGTTRLSIKHSKSTTVPVPTLDILEIFDFRGTPDYRSFKLNGQTVNINVQTSSYSPITKRLYISTKGLIDLSKGDVVLEWNSSSSSTLEFSPKMVALESNRYELKL
ncbi:unnamed protein product [Caenorhabditis auriculariae]|uniref:P-type domain-containing protein n=1 Tax=Caenorhabditis auriculariae TaxID=2777116 RepID=A0A8S1HKP9_9PELO|nr:unnamed protein product [Caenorhabditis auriculariae]